MVRKLTARKSPTRKSIPSTVKDALWRRECGDKLDGKCTVCEQPIAYNNCHIAHILALKNGGTDNIGNLTISCQSCNLSMGTDNLHDFRNRYFKKINSVISVVPVTPIVQKKENLFELQRSMLYQFVTDKPVCNSNLINYFDEVYLMIRS